MSEVGSAHSSDEACESRWSKGADKSTITRGEARKTQEVYKSVEHELKGIRYQSEKYDKLTTLINRINEDSLTYKFNEYATGGSPYKPADYCLNHDLAFSKSSIL